MKFYCFASQNPTINLQQEQGELFSVIQRIAQGTDTRDLVVALHLLQKSHGHGGTAYVRAWQTPSQFYARRGKWQISPTPPLPQDLPQRFKLIRISLPADPGIYPLVQMDCYHWQHRYPSRKDHLAFVFAHELHHFRRYHLNLHPHEGEHSANKWALQRALSCGFFVHSQKLTSRKHKRRREKPLSFFHLLNPMDFQSYYSHSSNSHCPSFIKRIAIAIDDKRREYYCREKLRHINLMRTLAPGTTVWICFDPSGKYEKQSAIVIKPLRKNAYRLTVETTDGKRWRWPAVWLSEKPPLSLSG